MTGRKCGSIPDQMGTVCYPLISSVSLEAAIKSAWHVTIVKGLTEYDESAFARTLPGSENPSRLKIST